MGIYRMDQLLLILIIISVELFKATILAVTIVIVLNISR